MFTDKAKEKFEEYFDNELYITEEFSTPNNWLGIEDFYNLGLSFQWGVILDFADSEGYYIRTWSENPKFSTDIQFSASLDYNDYGVNIGKYNTRKEAQQEAIKKLNELLNK